MDTDGSTDEDGGWELSGLAGLNFHKRSGGWKDPDGRMLLDGGMGSGCRLGSDGRTGSGGKMRRDGRMG